MEVSSESDLTIGQVARRAGVHVETIRYYERRRLLAEPPRRRSGYRAYPAEAIQRIRFIKSAQGLGFCLEEIAEMLELRVTPDTTCADVRQLAQTRLDEVEERIRKAQTLKRTLKRLIANCREDKPLSECPILDAMAEGPHT